MKEALGQPKTPDNDQKPQGQQIIFWKIFDFWTLFFSQNG